MGGFFVAERRWILMVRLEVQRKLYGRDIDKTLDWRNPDYWKVVGERKEVILDVPDRSGTYKSTWGRLTVDLSEIDPTESPKAENKRNIYGLSRNSSFSEGNWRNKIKRTYKP
jgi:hypothetical protein